jgi:ATP-dependent DNA helicase RecQ
MTKKRKTLKELRELAQDIFDFEKLRPEQEEAILSVLEGHDTLTVLPTGAGKSAIYQLAALTLNGPTIVVSPLIALQHDQVQALQARDTGGAAVLNSTLSAKEREATMTALAEGELEFLFLAPEQFGTHETLENLQAAKPSLFVVDEAHCIAEWGHDFRPDYLRLEGVLEALGHPTVLALTATAALPVREQIIARLGMREPRVIVHGFDRPNLELVVESFTSEEAKRERMIEAVKRADKPGIVYVATRQSAEELADNLQAHGIKSAPYHAGLSKDERQEAQEAFMRDDLEVIVATIAFGMGIDKPNVRFVFHYSIADSIDSYYQEIGRAGRDGEGAAATLFYYPEDLKLRRFMASGGLIDTEVLQEIAETVTAAKRPIDPRKLKQEVELSDSKLMAAVNRLEEAGVLEITPEGNLAPAEDAPAPEEAVAEVEKNQQNLKKYEQSRVDMMRGYAETRDCRRRYLLNYFGETYEGRCGRCDTCRAGISEAGQVEEGPFPIGSRILHSTFGGGQVMRYENDKIVVLFDDTGYQTLALELVLERKLLEPA